MVLIQYAGMSSCGNSITLYREIEGKYQEILETCGEVDSIGQHHPQDFYLWLFDSLYKYRWNAQDEKYLDSLVQEDNRNPYFRVIRMNSGKLYKHV